MPDISNDATIMTTPTTRNNVVVALVKKARNI